MSPSKFPVASAGPKDVEIPCSSNYVRVIESRVALGPFCPRIPKPPRGDLLSKGLQSRTAWCNSVRSQKAVDERMLKLVFTLRDACQRLLSQPEDSLERDFVAGTISGINAGLGFLWETVFGPTGFIIRLERQAKLHSEFRLFARYGDYAQEGIKVLKNYDWLWDDATNKEWEVLLVHLKRETMAWNKWNIGGKHGGRNGTPPATPWRNKLAAAAKYKDLSLDDFVAAIEFYVERNKICHSGIDELVWDGKFYELANSILRDEEVLDALYDGSAAYVALGKCIKRVRLKYFKRLVRAENQQPDYELTVEGVKRSDEAIQRERERKQNK